MGKNDTRELVLCVCSSHWWLAIIDLVGWTLVVVSGFKTRNHHTVFVDGVCRGPELGDFSSSNSSESQSNLPNFK